MNKKLNSVPSAGTTDEQRTAADSLPSASVEASLNKRDDVIPVYVNLIKNNSSQKDIQKVNNFIINKWSKSALIYIKEKAWKIVNDENKKRVELKNIVVLGQFTDGKIRQIITTKIEQLNISRLLIQLSREGKITAMENTIEGLDWKSDVDLRS